MQKVTVARNQIGPLLDQLIQELDAEGCATQKAYFTRIAGQLYCAHDDWELTSPIIELTSATALGFQFSQTADALVNRILQKAAPLLKELQGTRPHIH